MQKRNIRLNRFKIIRSTVFILILAVTALLAGCQSDKASKPASADSGVLLGIFHEGAQGNLSPVRDYEQKLGKNFASVMWFLDWSSPVSN